MEVRTNDKGWRSVDRGRRKTPIGFRPHADRFAAVGIEEEIGGVGTIPCFGLMCGSAINLWGALFPDLFGLVQNPYSLVTEMGQQVAGCWCWTFRWIRALSNAEQLRCNELLRMGKGWSDSVGRFWCWGAVGDLPPWVGFGVGRGDSLSPPLRVSAQLAYAWRRWSVWSFCSAVDHAGLDAVGTSLGFYKSGGFFLGLLVSAVANVSL
ncbi:hypothetical protein Ancab_030233 [Ancistrocladus abbreviatus]